jgi:hypothetical protein
MFRSKTEQRRRREASWLTCKRPKPRALHLAFLSCAGFRRAGSQREQTGDESGDRKFSRAVPYDMLWFRGPALTKVGRDADPVDLFLSWPGLTRPSTSLCYCIRIVDARVKSGHDKFRMNPDTANRALHLGLMPTWGFIRASPHREQSGDESGVRKSSGPVPFDMLWFWGRALTMRLRNAMAGHGMAQRATA